MKIKKKLQAAPASPATSTKDLPLRDPGGHVHRSFVFYGRSGTGKTTVLSTFPKKLLVLDVKDIGDDSISDVEGVKVMDVRTWDDFELAYWWLKRNPGKFDSLGIDTVSQLQQLAIRKVLEDKNKDADRAGDWGVMTKKEWGDVASLMKTWIINIRDLPMTTVFIAQDRTFNTGEEDAAEGLDPEVGPALSPSIAKHLNAAVHVIGNTFIRQRTVKVKLKNPSKGKSPFAEKTRTEFCMRVGPNAVYITKLRKPKRIEPPSILVDPTYDALVNIIRGKSE